MDAFLDGIERARAAGHDLTNLASVASFFVSRVDTEVDKRLEKIGSADASDLRGKAAIANARLAFERYEQVFSAERWQALAAAGAQAAAPPVGLHRRQGPVLRRHAVRRRAGRLGHRQHHARGDAGRRRRPRRGPRRHRSAAAYADARQVMADLASAGIDMDDVVQVLEDEARREVRDVLDRPAGLDASPSSSGCEGSGRRRDRGRRVSVSVQAAGGSADRRRRRPRRGRRPAGGQGRDPLGVRRPARGRPAARLARPAALVGGAAPPAARPARAGPGRRSRPRGARRAWAGRRWRPRSSPARPAPT